MEWHRKTWRHAAHHLSRGWLLVVVSRRAKRRDRVIARAERLVADAEQRVSEIESVLQSERERFRRELDERDHKIGLLELELRGFAAINTRYGQLIERDLAIFASQIEEARTNQSPQAGYDVR